jgi:hypothetical protein
MKVGKINGLITAGIKETCTDTAVVELGKGARGADTRK